MRICSLLPSTTEIVFALGKGDSLVGVTHECDFPPQTANLPKVTRSNIPAGLSSSEIDSAVSKALVEAGSLYELDLVLLEQLQPDIVLTQRLCDVCAVSYDHVQEVARHLSSHPQVLNVEPHSLNDILDSVVTVGAAVGAERDAKTLRENLQRRIDAIGEKTSGLEYRPRVFCMEWVDPPFCGGHWMQELVQIAGGHDDIAVLHRPSRRIKWERVLEFAPEAIVLTCCGFDLRRCAAEGETLAKMKNVQELPAVKNGRVYATDGSAYFSRPGPRIVDSLEILAYLVHPDRFPAPRLEGAFAAVHLALWEAKALP